ncbi:helix-turn-helix domain-containing protein [Acidobacteria bacterium AH-259-O06]|nr:helix-turn-helix domain-containing protein [Acidobacteria bacterium AH-259-O06]
MNVTRQTKLEDLPELLTPEEFRAYLGLGRTTVYELIRSGDLPVKRFGRRVWIPKEVLRREDSF